MFNIFKKPPQNLPRFWKEYEACFEGKPPELVKDTQFIVLDTETTGFSYKNDRMLSIGAVKVQGNNINVSDTFEYYIKQDKFNPESVKIHGILPVDHPGAISEEEALVKFLKYIGNSILVAHHAHFDVTMINTSLKRHNLPNLKNKVLDTGWLYKKTLLNSNLINKEKNYSLDEIADAFIIETKDRHTATGDAYITAIAFLKILGRLDKKKDLKTKQLLKM